MDLQRAREKEIPGYEHPTSENVNRDKLYKTFTEGKKKKKNETFGTTSIGNNIYSTLEKIENSTEIVLICPKCKGEAVKICPCGYNDKKCENEHVWFTDRTGKVKIGNPH